MVLDFPMAAVLCGAPFRRQLLEEGGIDASVVLVDIGGVDAVLEPVACRAQPPDGGPSVDAAAQPDSRRLCRSLRLGLPQGAPDAIGP